MPEPVDTLKIDVPDADKLRALCGGQNEHLKLIARRTGAQVGGRGSQLLVSGTPAQRKFVERLVGQLLDLVTHGYQLYPEDVDQAIRLLSTGDVSLREFFLDT